MPSSESLRRVRTLLCGTLVVLGVGCAGVVSADMDSNPESVSIAATVVGSGSPANPIVEFHGLASPSATVTVTRNGTTVATQVASSAAAFNITLTDQPTGQQSYTIGALDSSSLPLTSVTFALNLTSGGSTIITGIFLGPSIAVDNDAVKLGQFVTVAGRTTPSSSVTLTVQSDPVHYTVTSGGDGFWSKLVNTLDIGVGSHTAQAQTLSGSQVSGISSIVTFAVNPLEQCDGKRTADLNCDGKVNLTDFSILLFFWQQTTPSNGRADVNNDGRVDVVDFSIQLYQWTG